MMMMKILIVSRFLVLKSVNKIKHFLQQLRHPVLNIFFINFLFEQSWSSAADQEDQENQETLQNPVPPAALWSTQELFISQKLILTPTL